MDRVHHHCERKEGSDRVAESHFGVNLAPASELEARFLARALPADVRGVADEKAIFPRGRGERGERQNDRSDSEVCFAWRGS